MLIDLVLADLDNAAYIFGGEIQPRKPVDNYLDVVSLSPGRFFIELFRQPSKRSLTK